MKSDFYEEGFSDGIEESILRLEQHVGFDKRGMKLPPEWCAALRKAMTEDRLIERKNPADMLWVVDESNPKAEPFQAYKDYFTLNNEWKDFIASEQERHNRTRRVERFAAELCTFWNCEVGRWDEDCAHAEMKRRHPEMTASEFGFAWQRLVGLEQQHYKAATFSDWRPVPLRPWIEPGNVVFSVSGVRGSFLK